MLERTPLSSGDQAAQRHIDVGFHGIFVACLDVQMAGDDCQQPLNQSCIYIYIVFLFQ